MKLTSLLAIYVLFWIFSIFLVLPFRLKNGAAEDQLVPGQAESAPSNFSVKRTALWTTIVSAVLCAIFYINYVEGWVGPEFFDLFSTPA